MSEEKVLLSSDNQKTLMLLANERVEECAAASAKAVVDGVVQDSLVYPPNGGLNQDELEALKGIQKIPHIESALRKVIADSSAKAFFDFFDVLDGTGDPNHEVGEWTGATLLNRPQEEHDPYSFMLHDAFFDAYWAWRKARGHKGWALDNLPDGEVPEDVWSSYSETE